MLESVDSHELAEWEAFDNLEPIDHARRAETSAGIVCQTLGNIHRDRNTDRYDAADFMIDWDKPWKAAVEIDLEAARNIVAHQVESALAQLKLGWEEPRTK